MSIRRASFDTPVSTTPVDTPSVSATPTARATDDTSRAQATTRPADADDRLFTNATADLHADTPLHNLDLQGDGNPGFFMRMWIGVLKFLGHLFPSVQNFTRQVTRDSLDQQRAGLQVMSQVTKGLPPFFTASFDAYTGLVANYPDAANDTALNASLFQIGWTLRQVRENSDRLIMASSADDVRSAVAAGQVAVQVGLEGAFPLEVHEGDIEAFRRLLAEPGALPPDMPLPTEDQLRTLEGRLSYYASLGTAYIGLNHLASSCYSGSDLATAENRHMGLSVDGHRLVQALDRSGVMLDVAHASQKAQQDVVAMVERGQYALPLLVSHCVVPLEGQEVNWRMTHPSVLDAVKRTGGVVGIMYARAHLPHGGSRDPQDVINDICDQIDAVRARIGIDHVALGSDADGFVGLPFATVEECNRAVFAELQRRGYSEEDLCKIRGGNYLHTLERRDRILQARRQRTARQTTSAVPSEPGATRREPGAARANPDASPPSGR